MDGDSGESEWWLHFFSPSNSPSKTFFDAPSFYFSLYKPILSFFKKIHVQKTRGRK